MTQLEQWQEEYDFELERFKRRMHALNTKLTFITHGQKVYPDWLWDEQADLDDDKSFVALGGCTHP